MKKITSLLLLLLVSVMSGVSAWAQVVFETSPAPSNGVFSADTKWYKMTLKGYYVSALDTDEDGNLYANKTAEAYGEQSWWCIVGDATNGYKFYNKYAGADKVLSMSDMTRDGAARAKLSEESGNTQVTSFELNTKDDVTDVFYIKDKNSTWYVNNRAPYFSNWDARSLGDGGSQVKFYAVEDQDADVAAELSNLKNTLQENIANAKTLEGEAIGYYAAANIAAAEEVYNTVDATALDLRAAIKTLTPNQPEVGVLYRLVSAYSGFETKQGVKKGIYADESSVKWGTVNTANPCSYWYFVSKNGKTYLQNAANHMYFNTAAQLSDEGRAVTWAFPLNNAGVPVANLRTGTDMPFHAGGHGSGAGVSSGLIGYGYFGSETDGASAWYIVPATLAEVHTMTVDAMVNSYPTTEDQTIMGYYKKSEVESLKASMSRMASCESLEEANAIFATLAMPMLPVFDSQKFYRIELESASLGHLALGTRTIESGDVCAYASAKDNSTVDFIWQIAPAADGKYNLKNLNTGLYLQPVLAGADAKTKLGAEVSPYELRLIEPGVYRLYNTGSWAAQVESNNSNTYFINSWDSDNSKWHIYVVNDIEVPLTTIEDHAYATTCMPFPVSAVNGAKAYTGVLNADADAITLNEATGFAANEGVLLMGDANTEKAVLAIGGEAAEVTSNVLQGTCSAITLTDDNRADYRVLGVNADDPTEVGFFRPSSSVASIPANRAYLNETLFASLAEGLSINFGGMVEGIANAGAAVDQVNAPVYDLTGRRVVKAVKGGVYIQNGKKFIVK